MLSLSERTERWVKMGKPFVDAAEWQEIAALIEVTDGPDSAEVTAEVARRMPRWIEQGKAKDAAEKAAKAEQATEAAEPTVDAAELTAAE